MGQSVNPTDPSSFGDPLSALLEALAHFSYAEQYHQLDTYRPTEPENDQINCIPTS
jgi:hypothetical protein